MASHLLLLVLALSQHFARGYLPLIDDDVNKYYKVPVPWGLHMYSGVVEVVCESAGMSSVCWYNGDDDEEYKYNLKPCIFAYRANDADGITALNSMAKLFEATNGNCQNGPTACPELYGIFTSKKADLGDYGIVNGKVQRKRAVSEATAENQGQFWALCAEEK